MAVGCWQCSELGLENVAEVLIMWLDWRGRVRVHYIVAGLLPVGR